METEAPKRKRGRPKGSKNKPKHLEKFIAHALESNHEPPPKKPKGPPRGIWAKLKTPEERKAYAAKILAMRPPDWERGRKAGVPWAWKSKDFAVVKEAVEKEVDKLMEILEKKDLLPDDDMAKEALRETCVVLRTTGSFETKLRAARLILDFTKQKPASKAEVQISAAEKWLADLAMSEGD